MLATAAGPAEVRDGWLYEFKWDGVRAMVERDTDGNVAMFSRRGNDITSRYPETHGVVGGLQGSAVFDGEVVALGDDGRPSFETLQSRMHLSDPARVAAAARSQPVVLMVFDLLELGGRSLIALPYTERRRLLLDLGLDGPRWQAPGHHDGDLDMLLQAAAANGLEGVVAKRPESPYRPGVRSDDWRKIRLMHRQEFVVGGWLRGSGGRSATFGSLLVGYHDEVGALRYAGAVGSGFSDRLLAELQPVLDRLEVARTPFSDPVPKAEQATFVEPVLVVEVQFAHWTREGVLRQPSFKGVRTDKTAGDVVYVPGTPEGPPVRDTGA